MQFIAQKTLKTTGVHYFFMGARLLLHPELRFFLWVPLLINIVLFIVLTSVLGHYFGEVLDALFGFIPEWLHFLAWLLWLIFVALLLVVYSYCFNFLTSIIAAPFYGLLAQKVQELMSGPITVVDESFWQLIPRTFGREWQKLAYFIPRSCGLALLVLLGLFIPIFNMIIPLLVFIWGAWCMSIQFCDYAADNNQLSFIHLRQQMAQQRISSLGFGSLCLLAGMVPLVNIVAMPAAVVGGTLFWIAQKK